VLLIGAVGFVLWQQYIGKNIQPEVSSPLPQVILTPRKDDMVNWKTYTNTQYGFGIQLPSDWQIQVNQNVVSFNSQENVKVFEQAKKEKRSEGPASNITFLAYDDIAKQASNEGIALNSKTLEEYVRLSQNNFVKTQKISFAGQIAFRGSELGMFDTDAIWIQKSNHLYKIWLESNVGMDTQLSDKILSTFKFIK